MADDHSFRKLLPGFVIPAGTQVVLKAAKTLPDGEQFKPPGSVGVVLESPPNNHQPYLVRFADGRDGHSLLPRIGAAAARGRGRIGRGHRGPAALDHLPLPGRLEGVRLGQRRFRRRLAGHLPASGTAALVAAPPAGTVGVRRRASGTKSIGNWRSSCGWR